MNEQQIQNLNKLIYHANHISLSSKDYSDIISNNSLKSRLLFEPYSSNIFIYSGLFGLFWKHDSELFRGTENDRTQCWILVSLQVEPGYIKIFLREDLLINTQHNSQDWSDNINLNINPEKYLNLKSFW